MNAKVKLPEADYLSVLEPGGIKKIKTENRRSDSTYLVRPQDLHVDPKYNVRVRTPSYEAYIRELADDMLQNGYDPGQPVTAKVAKVNGDDVLVIRAGNTRREAALLAIEEGAEFKTIPVIIRPKTDNQVDETIDLAKSNSGRPLTPYELSIVVKRLMNMELSEADICRQLKLTPSYVNGLVLLAGAPRKIAMMVIEDKVAAAVAVDLMRKHGYAKAEEMLDKAIAKAASAGKTRVTPAALPDAAYKKAIKSKAPALLETAELIRQDSGFSQLSPENQERLSALLDELQKLRSTASDEATDTVGSNAGAHDAAPGQESEDGSERLAA